MRIVVFGSTGRTGSRVIDCALERGHHVHAVARNPDAVRRVDDRLTVSAGNAEQPEHWRAVIEGADAVVSAVGVGPQRQPTTVHSATMNGILSAASSDTVVIAISAIPVDRTDHGVIGRALVLPILYSFFGSSYRDMARMESTMASADVDWVVVRPPRLTDKPTTGTYRAAVDGALHGASHIRRGDLAIALMDAVTEQAWRRRVVRVAA
nr:NAD(P)H-binding protein [Rhodococcus sp. (in: high G+C Gram-positive bacteria)]